MRLSVDGEKENKGCPASFKVFLRFHDNFPQRLVLLFDLRVLLQYISPPKIQKTKSKEKNYLSHEQIAFLPTRKFHPEWMGVTSDFVGSPIWQNKNLEYYQARKGNDTKLRLDYELHVLNHLQNLVFYDYHRLPSKHSAVEHSFKDYSRDSFFDLLEEANRQLGIVDNKIKFQPVVNAFGIAERIVKFDANNFYVSQNMTNFVIGQASSDCLALVPIDWGKVEKHIEDEVKKLNKKYNGELEVSETKSGKSSKKQTF